MDEKRIWNEVYSVLVQVCGATNSPMWRQLFIQLHLKKESLPREYRFQGDLGFGGKLHHEYDGFRVDCYLEDLTVFKSNIIKEANEKLKPIYKQYEELKGG